jgi:CelD/BcsL family acetyltransferase involved in cellulose biosynthesis
MMWRFEICEDWDVIWSDAYQERWMQIMIISPNTHVFFHPSLVKAWVKTYLPLRNISPIFFFGKETESGNEVFFPLILWKRNWRSAFLHSIVPVGYSDFDYHDPIFTKGTDSMKLDDFWQGIGSYLKAYHPDNIILDGVHTVTLPIQYKVISEEPCPYLDLSEISSEKDLMSFFQTSLRGDIRRQIRRLSELGDLIFKDYKSFEEAKETFSLFIKEHSLKWPNAYKAPHFHENLLKEGLGTTIHFSSLNIGATAIAWHLGFEYKGIYYYYMPAGNHEYAKFSPVKIHLYYLMKRAVENKFMKYDHLKGDETYKGGWSNGVDYVKTLYWNNSSVTSSTKLFINRSVRSLIK